MREDEFEEENECLCDKDDICRRLDEDMEQKAKNWENFWETPEGNNTKVWEEDYEEPEKINQGETKEDENAKKRRMGEKEQ